MSIKKYVENMKKRDDRDLNVLWYCMPGIALKEDIYHDIFIDEIGNRLRRQGCERRLEHLEKVVKVIKKRQYVTFNKKITVYSLTELGCDIVAEQFNIERDFIRSGFCNDPNVMHEIVLARIYRKIWREVREKKYQIEHIYDEIVMKSKIKPNRGVFYPDACLRVHRPQNGTIDVYIEYDNGNKGLSYWVPKICSWNITTLVLASNQDRVNRLKHYIWNSRRKVPTAFAVASDFIATGLLSTEWDWLPSKRRGVFDLS